MPKQLKIIHLLIPALLFGFVTCGSITDSYYLDSEQQENSELVKKVEPSDIQNTENLQNNQQDTTIQDQETQKVYQQLKGIYDQHEKKIQAAGVIVGITLAAAAGIRIKRFANTSVILDYLKRTKSSKKALKILYDVELKSPKQVTILLDGFDGSGKPVSSLALKNKLDATNVFSKDHLFIDYTYENFAPKMTGGLINGFKDAAIHLFKQSNGSLEQNKDVIDLVKLVIKLQRKGLKVNLVGFSGGGVLASEIKQILSRLNIDVKSIAVGSPYLLYSKGNDFTFTSKLDFIENTLPMKNRVYLNTVGDHSDYFNRKEFHRNIKFLLEDISDADYKKLTPSKLQQKVNKEINVNDVRDSLIQKLDNETKKYSDINNDEVDQLIQKIREVNDPNDSRAQKKMIQLVRKFMKKNKLTYL